MSQTLTIKNESSKNIDNENIQQNFPSSFSINPQYFNGRLVRIKEKIDTLKKQHVLSQNQSVNIYVKDNLVDEQKRISYQTEQTNHTSYGQMRQTISIEKITEEMKQKIQNIYVKSFSIYRTKYIFFKTSLLKT